MAMTDEEILSAAGRLRAAKRRRVAKTCPVCGTPFEGVAQRRYCSAACRVRAARTENGPSATHLLAPPLGPDAGTERRAEGGKLGVDDENAEPSQRPRRNPTSPLEGTAETAAPPPGAPRDDANAILARLDRTREKIMRGRLFDDDSVETLRQAREDRSGRLERAMGGGLLGDRRRMVTDDAGDVTEASAFPEGAVTARPGSAAAEPPRGDDEPIADYFERISLAMTSGRPLDDDSVDVLRQERERRDEELDRRVRS